MTRRATGAGTVEQFRGRFRARLPDEKRSVLGVYDSQESAERALDAYFAVSVAPRGDSLASYGPGWLKRRELAKYAGIEQDRQRWKDYVEPWDCVQWPMREIRRGDVRRWVDGLGKADQTRRNALNLLRGCLRAAVDDELIERNPAEGLRIHATGNEEDTWAYLTMEEQSKLLLCRALPPHLRDMISFAIGAGLRWGEQKVLRLEDVHIDDRSPYVYVRAAATRRGGRKAPKNKKHRKVPLFGVSLAGARALHARATSRKNPRGLLLLPPRGEAYRGANGPRLDKWLKEAAIEKHIRWHDLRHTCASSLVAGWWGRKWALDEIRDLLGHSSITVTERYAHLAGSVVEQAARETPGGAIAEAITTSPKYRATLGIRTPDLRFTKPHINASDLDEITAVAGAMMAPWLRRLVHGLEGLRVEADLYTALETAELSGLRAKGSR